MTTPPHHHTTSVYLVQTLHMGALGHLRAASQGDVKKNEGTGQLSGLLAASSKASVEVSMSGFGLQDGIILEDKRRGRVEVRTDRCSG
ncbi:hypothetical protein E2C01_090688 [Portunus trituberculatus]|uniref:Uncharacterized protein n=1 Tax=Portunus trituberculatus TaxID=210409 RepID=A0A5B7JT32_PORTR|nr:hypothetical protein [Portunus trituberculatus]